VRGYQHEEHEGHEVKEPVPAYNDVFDGKMGLLSTENRLIWNIYPDI
jgi:putative transposase